MELCCIFFFLKNIGRQLATLESGVGDCKSWPSFIPSAVDCQPRQGANPTPLLFFQWGGFFLAKFHYNLRPQNPPQNPLSPVEEGIFHPQKMDLKWPLKQEKFRSKDWIISLYTNSLGWGSCVVVQTLVPTPQKIRLEVRLVWRRFALFNAEELAVSFAGPLGLPWDGAP